MENAGKGTVDAMVRHYGNLANKKIRIFVGPGNNGGDGLVIARHLHQQGSTIEVCLLVEAQSLQGDAAINMRIVEKLPIPVTVVPDEKTLNKFTGCWDISIDALFGTGLKRDISGHFQAAVELMNQASAPVVAVDIPSGLDSDTGQVWGCVVQADLTCTYGLAKFGQIQFPGRDLAGKLEVIDIGIPPQVVEQTEIHGLYLQNTSVQHMLPSRQTDGHKGSHGHVAILAGSTGKTGAAILATEGSLRAGAGLVSLFVPNRLNTIFEISCPEAMTIPLAGLAGQALGAADWPEIERELTNKKCVVAGPGLGQAKETAELVNMLVSKTQLPLVLDADALNGLNITSLSSRPQLTTILTPHPGEMASLLMISSAEVQANRLMIAQEFANRHQVIVVLKGAATIIAAPNGQVAINSTGNYGMATGGMGDVLAGIIAGLLSQGLSDWHAACLGTYLHGRAGDLHNEEHEPWGYLASELAARIPQAIGELHQ